MLNFQSSYFFVVEKFIKKFMNLALVNSEDKSLEFLASANYEAQMLVEVQGESATSKEYLLIFNKVAVYDDELGNS